MHFILAESNYKAQHAQPHQQLLMTYSIKKAQSMFWKLNHTTERVTELHEAGKIDASWLICPNGEAERAIPVGVFLENSKTFELENSARSSDARGDVPDNTEKSTIPHPLMALGLKVSYAAGAVKVFCYIGTYFLLKPAATRVSGNLLAVQPNSPSIGFATFRECLNDFSTLLLIFGLATLLAGLVLDRIEQTKARGRA